MFQHNFPPIAGLQSLPMFSGWMKTLLEAPDNNLSLGLAKWGIKPQTLVLRDYAFLPLAIVMGKSSLYIVQVANL